MSVLIKIVRSRVGFFSSLCTTLAGRRSLTGRCSCWAVDWKCCHREQGKGEVAGLWQSELEMEEAFCHLHRAVTQLNVGENVWIWVLNLILCSPGWEVCKGSCSAHMDGIVLPHHCYLMMLSWLTLRESPWFKREGQHKTILFRIQGEKAGDTPLTKPPCVTSLCHHVLICTTSDTPPRCSYTKHLLPALGALKQQPKLCFSAHGCAHFQLWQVWMQPWWLQSCTLISLTSTSSEEAITICYSWFSYKIMK